VAIIAFVFHHLPSQITNRQTQIVNPIQQSQFFISLLLFIIYLLPFANRQSTVHIVIVIAISHHHRHRYLLCLSVSSLWEFYLVKL